MERLLKGLKALAHETRLRLIHILLTQDLCGRALSRRLGISEAAVSQHIKILKKAGLVAGEKRGYWIHYSVQREVLEQITGELERLTYRSANSADHCHGLRARNKGSSKKEVKEMCQSCCEFPEKLKDRHEDYIP
jgi:DNA-binding transcriptional ArsR family regulator